MRAARVNVGQLGMLLRVCLLCGYSEVLTDLQVLLLQLLLCMWVMRTARECVGQLLCCWWICLRCIHFKSFFNDHSNGFSCGPPKTLIIYMFLNMSTAKAFLAGHQMNRVNFTANIWQILMWPLFTCSSHLRYITCLNRSSVLCLGMLLVGIVTRLKFRIVREVPIKRELRALPTTGKFECSLHKGHVL